MKKYIEKVLDRFNVVDAKPLGVPLQPHVKLSKDDCPKDDDATNYMKSVPYASACVKSILRYLKGTKNKCLSYGKGPLELKGFCDSDMAGDVDTRKSTSGYVFTIAGGVVSWCSRLQKIVALSTTEAECISATQTSKEAIWLARLCSEFD
ncbi:hypothetical protein KP509_22G076900, partial [Ceratopteris richardii]